MLRVGKSILYVINPLDSLSDALGINITTKETWCKTGSNLEQL